MSQVRKDILNGWKEIAGYVGRDIRTVERWEKQRGLPVRRVPGAGRATVYALIPELDEWLENSTPDPADLPAESRESDPIASTGKAPNSGPGSPLPSHVMHASEASQAEEISASAGTLRLRDVESTSESEDLRTASGDTVRAWPTQAAGKQASVPTAAKPGKLILINPESTAGAPVGRSSGAGKTRAWLTWGSWRRGDGVIITVAAILLCLIVVPVGRGHAKPSVEPQKLSWNSGPRNSTVAYRSKVPGVDDLYLRGIYSYEQRTAESLGRSEEDFSSAIEKDPSYAPAYAALANTYNLLREYSVMPEQEAYPKAKAAAEHAIALDPSLPEAHASLGFVDFFWSWDTVKAEREFRTAIALDPSSALAHHWYGSMLIHEGRFAEALEHLNVAQRLEPTSAAILSTRALALGLSGHRIDAVDTLQDLISESPSVTSPHAILGTLSRVEPRDPALFLYEMRRVAELRHNDEMLHVVAAAEPAYRSGGENAMWSAILATEERLHPGAANRTYMMVDAETGLGRFDAAFADLTLLMRRRDPNVIGVVVDPTLLPLRQDRRFGALVASIGLPALPH